MSETLQVNPYAGDRTGTIIGAAGALLAGGAVLYFWLTGLIGLVGGNGGTMLALQLEGAWRTLFMLYPIVLVAAAVVGGVLLALKRDLEALGVLGLPVVVAIGYYFALIHLRPV